VLPRFLLYGCVGWVLEVCFTGTSAAIFQRDRHGTAKTFLWMHPIYGLTALALERLYDRLKRRPRAVRALAYTGVIFGAEYATGWLLRRGLGECPWDYSHARWNLHGLIRLDYAPAWYATALAFEPVREAFLKLTSEALRQTPEYREARAEGTELLAEATGGPVPPASTFDPGTRADNALPGDGALTLTPSAA
jgi:Putative ABC-transporter type IV